MLKFLSKRAGSSPYYQIKCNIILAAAGEDELEDIPIAKRHYIRKAREALAIARTTYVHDSDDSTRLDSLQESIEEEEVVYRCLSSSESDDEED